MGAMSGPAGGWTRSVRDLLYVAIAVFLGIVFVATGSTAIGATLVFVGAGSMVAAGLVLLLSDRSKARAAMIQLTAPLLGVVLLAIGLAL